MTLKTVWRANITGSAPPAVETLYAAGPTHDAAYVTAPLERSTAWGEPVLTNLNASNWRLFRDINHRPSLLYQMAIMRVGQTNGLPQNLNIMGGELSIRIGIGRDLFMPNTMQILLHAQWVNEEAFFGHGTTHNAVFVPKGRPTLDQALGAPAPKNRPPNGSIIPAQNAFIDYTFKYDWQELHDVGARPDRVFPGYYSPIGNTDEERQRVFTRKLANSLIVFHIPDYGNVKVESPDWHWMGKVVAPTYEPPNNRDNPDVGGIWYISKMELKVDADLNPNAVELT